MDHMTIYNRLKVLIAEKEIREGRKLPYRTIAKETSISTSTLTAYIQQRTQRYDVSVLNTLCKYFDCQPGDILVYQSDDPWEMAESITEEKALRQKRDQEILDHFDNEGHE